MSTHAITPITRAFKPLTQITPFTTRDYTSFMQWMQYITDYIADTLTDELNEKLKLIYEETQKEVDRLSTSIEASKNEWRELFDTFMDNVIEELEALNDASMANLINTPTSKTHEALEALYATKAELDNTIQSIVDLITAFEGTVENEIAQFKADTDVELAKFVLKSTLMVNVRDFGAKGDGVTNDAPSVQAAINSLGDNGGRVFFPSGDYYMRNATYLKDNLEIFGANATLRKKHGDPTYCIFIGSSGSRQGYGAGASNLYVHNLSVRGVFGANPYAVCLLALHHSDNVTVARIDVQEASGNGHRFDLQGCRYVHISDSVFRGFDPSMGSNYNEDIQPDYSSKRSGSFLEANVICYDGLPSQHITVEDCQWLPLTLGGAKYPAANPFGTHGSVYQRWVSDLVFRNNLIVEPVDDRGSVVPGSVSMVAVKNVLIENNKFVGTNNPSNGAIMFYQGTGGQDPNLVQTDEPSISYPTPMRCENITIRGNTVEGYHNSPSIIRVKGSAEVRAFDVEVVDNHLHNTNESSGVVNSGALTIDLGHVQRVKISGNTVRHSRRFAVLDNALDVVVSGNVSSSNSLNDLTMTDCNRVSITGNSFNSVRGYGIYSPGSNGVTIVGNTFASVSGATQPMIHLANVPMFSVVGNSLVGFTATLGIYTTSSGGVISGNVLDGFSTPITPAVTTGQTTIGTNALV